MTTGATRVYVHAARDFVWFTHTGRASPRRLSGVATRRINEDDALVAVPRDALLTPRTARECPRVGAACRRLSDWQALVLKLLLERASGADSEYAPYLRTLPPQPAGPEDVAAFTHPLLWPDGLAESLLHGSLMLPKLRQSLKQCDEDAVCIREALRDCPCSDLRDVPSDADVRWAASMVLSRAFYLPGVDEDLSTEEHEDDDGDAYIGDDAAVLALVPWADALNHSSRADERSVLQYDPHDRCAVLFAHRRYGPGEEVFDSYSPGKSPVDTLLEYGFVEPRSVSVAADRADVPAAHLGAVAQDNAALLTSVGLDPATAIASLGEDGPDTGVLAWLRVASATPEELAAAGWNAASYAHADARAGSQAGYDVMGRFMSPQCARNERAALDRLLGALDTQCGAYATTLDDDMARLDALEGQQWRPGRPHAELQVLRAVVSERLALEGSRDAVRTAMRSIS